MGNKTNVNLAYLPDRGTHQRVIDSIKDQCNNYYAINGEGGKGDCEKFRFVYEQQGYIFTIDDDLVYPENYVETMIKHIERYDRKCIITLHGRTFEHLPVKSYYRGRKKGYHWDRTQPYDVVVDAGGTGVMAWHSDTIRIDYNEISRGNMADIWMAVFARRAKVQIVCVKHETGWLKYIGPDEDFDNPQTIYSEKYNNDEIETQIFNDGCKYIDILQ